MRPRNCGPQPFPPLITNHARKQYHHAAGERLRKRNVIRRKSPPCSRHSPGGEGNSSRKANAQLRKSIQIGLETSSHRFSRYARSSRAGFARGSFFGNSRPVFYLMAQKHRSGAFLDDISPPRTSRSPHPRNTQHTGSLKLNSLVPAPTHTLHYLVPCDLVPFLLPYICTMGGGKKAKKMVTQPSLAWRICTHIIWGLQE